MPKAPTVFFLLLTLSACVVPPEPPMEQPPVAQTSSSPRSVSSSSSSSVHVPTEVEKAQELKRTEKIIREMTIPTPSPGDIACTNTLLGISFYHPESWGKCECGQRPGREGGISAGCSFTKSDFMLTGLSSDFREGRGGTTEEGIAKSDPKTWGDVRFYGEDNTPIVRRELATGEEMQIWHDWPVGWDTGDYVFGFRAPIKHPSVKIVGFAGPLSTSSKTAEKDIRDFLLVAYTYQLLP